ESTSPLKTTRNSARRGGSRRNATGIEVQRRPQASMPAWIMLSSSENRAARNSGRRPRCVPALCPAQQSGFIQPFVHIHPASGAEDRRVSDFHEVLRNRPEWFLRCDPFDAVETCEVHWPRVRAQCLFAFQIVVVLEERQRELAQSPIYRRAESQARVIGFSDCSPEAIRPIHRNHVIVIAHRFEIENQRRPASGT